MKLLDGASSILPNYVELSLEQIGVVTSICAPKFGEFAVMIHLQNRALTASGAASTNSFK